MEEIACTHCPPKCFIYNLDEADLGGLIPSRLRSYPNKSIVFAEGEDLRGSFLICQGRVRLFQLNAEGNSLILAIAKPGDVIGIEDVLAEQDQYSMYAQAMEDLKLRFLPSGSFHAALQRSPNLSYRLLTSLSQQVHGLRNRLLVTAYGNIRERLIKALFCCLSDYNHCPAIGSVTVDLRINGETLSQMVGCSSRSLGPELRRLFEEGIIVREGYRILIPDSAKLSSLI